jgi:hypothetical protein
MSANVTSVEVVKAFKLALQQFEEEVESALIQLDLESRRAIEWIENDRARYWPAEERKAATMVAEARLSLERAEQNTSGDTKYAFEERKILEKAKRRQRLAEAKTQAVRQWKREIHKEVETFQVHLAKLKHFMEADYSKGIVALERINVALERYIHQQAPASDSASDASGGPA